MLPFFVRLWNPGGDFASSLSTLSSFSAHCIAGRYRNVRQLLERSSVRQGKNLSDLVELLETRETAMRLSPLLLVFCMLRKLAEGEASLRPSKSTSAPDEACEIQSSKIPSENQKETTLLQQNLLKVVSVLLEYGARPDAKDVAGRTVCFYGAGVCANEASLVATTMCIGAAVSAHCFGKEVVLRDMKDDSFNGIRGIAAGYRTETAQRIVYLFGRKKEEYARNRNIRLVQDPCRSQHSTVAIPPPDEYFNLCNVQNRLGRVCLANLFHSTRRDVAIFLLHKHEASIDIPDWNGDTLRANSLLRGNQVELGVGQFIAAEVIKRARNEQKHNQNNCSACGKHGWKESPMRVCKSWYVHDFLS